MGIAIIQGNIGDIVDPPFVSALNNMLGAAQVSGLAVQRLEARIWHS